MTSPHKHDWQHQGYIVMSTIKEHTGKHLWMCKCGVELYSTGKKPAGQIPLDNPYAKPRAVRS